MEAKTCSRCSETKAVGDFHRRTRSPDGRSPECAACNIKVQAAYRTKNPEAHRRGSRRWRLKNVYNTTEEQVEQMTADQGGKCAICDLEGPLVIDHDHKTGQVRWMLCRRCNLALGHFDDDPVRIARAAGMLDKWLADYAKYK